MPYVRLDIVSGKGFTDALKRMKEIRTSALGEEASFDRFFFRLDAVGIQGLEGFVEEGDLGRRRRQCFELGARGKTFPASS